MKQIAPKLNTKRVFFVGLAFMVITMFWQVYDQIIAKMLHYSFGFNHTASGVILALDNILALFLLPIFGSVSDRTQHKRGRRTPYIIVGVILSAVLFMGVGGIDAVQQESVKRAGIGPVITVKDSAEKGYRYSDILYLKGTVVENPETGKAEVVEHDTAERKYFVRLDDAREAAMRVRQEDVWAHTQDHVWIVIGYIFVLCLVLTVMCVYRSPAVSLMPDVVIKPLRSPANAIINLMATLGGVIVLVVILLTARDFHNYLLTFGILALLMLAGLALFLWTVDEPRFVKEAEAESRALNISDTDEDLLGPDKMPKAVKISFIFILLAIVAWYMAYNAATSKISVYASRVLDMDSSLIMILANASALVMFLPIGFISRKIGRKITIIAGVVILTIAFAFGFFATIHTRWCVYVAMSLAGVGWATINVNSYPMVVEMSRGSSVGKYTGYYYTAVMAAQIATPVLSGLLMDHSALGMRVLFPYSVAFCLLALALMFFVRHGEAQKPLLTKTAE